jgi:hypothetical protein
VVFDKLVNDTGNDASEYVVGFEFVAATPFNSYVMLYVTAFHFAYKVVLPAKICDEDTAYDEPVPAAFVFHPSKVYPVLARLPEFDANVTAEPFTVAADCDGTEPDVFEFPLYVTVYVHFA